MIRTLLVIAALGISVLFLPLWIQLILFFIAVWVSPYRLLIVIPALFADVLYSSTGALGINTMLMTLVVLVVILIRWLLLTQTRFANVIYGMEI